MIDRDKADVPWDHCVECGVPLWDPPRSRVPRCNACRRAKFGGE